MHRFASYLTWVITFSALFFISCAHSDKLTVAFTEVGLLKKGSNVYAGENLVGQVKDYISNSRLDTIFVKLQVNNKIQIPKGSIFYIEENLLGDSKIMVEFSKSNEYLSKKDISIGEFRALKR